MKNNNKTKSLLTILLVFFIFDFSYAQTVLNEAKFEKYIIKSFSDRVVKLYIQEKLISTIPFNENVSNYPNKFMEDVDFDGDLDLFISKSCGQNCNYEVYTNYKGNFSLNKEISKFAFMSDYKFNKNEKYFYFIEHISASEHTIKFYKWINSKLICYKILNENDIKHEGYYDVTNKELIKSKWVIKKYRSKITN